MSGPVKLVPKNKRLDGRIREQLQLAIERFDQGHITSIAIVAAGDDELSTSYVGDAIPLLYALENLKLELLSDD